MTGARPTVIVSLPARSVEEARREAEAARAAGADGVEVRLDRWPPEERARLADLLPAPLPVLVTLRSTEEGGDGPSDPAERADELGRIGHLPVRWIDLELGRDTRGTVALPSDDRPARIVSCHLTEETASQWPLRLAELAATRGIGKLIVPASIPLALGEIAPRLEARRDEPVVVHTTGPSGPILRALARRLGLPIVFAALPVAVGSPPVERSQIPVDRLQRFFAAEGTPPLFGVVGRPIGHSESPAVHTYWMRDDRRTGIYLPLECASDDEFLASIPLLAEYGFRGLNVTHPFKAAAFEAATDVRPGAGAVGVANCLTLREDEVVAENTDLAAILRRLTELKESGRWDGRYLAVIGAGGAARATLAAARLLSAHAIVRARRAEAAESLAREFGARAGDVGSTEQPSLVVHATPVGRAGAGPIDATALDVFAGCTYLLDWVYRPEEAHLRTAAQGVGATYEDGWRLFVYQAAASYATWWDAEPSPESIERTLAEGGCAG